MKRVLCIALFAVALLTLDRPPCLAASQNPLTRVQQVVELSKADAARSIPVSLEATVTFVQPNDGSLFIQEDGYGIFCTFNKNIGLLPGDRVVVSGVTVSSFRTDIAATDVHFLSHGSLPTPRPAKFEDLIQSKLDSILVTVQGRILSATLDRGTGYSDLRFHLKVPHGIVEGEVAWPGNLRAEDLLDADVQLTGVAGGAFDSKMQMGGVWLDMNTPAEVVVVHPAAQSVWSQPAIPMDEIIHAYRISNDSERVRITGTLTYFEPGSAAVIEQNGKSMLVGTGTTLPLHAGAAVEATGFPEITDDSVWMDHGELRPLATNSQIQPQEINWSSASQGKMAYNLVAMEGQIVGIVHDSRVDLFILLADGHLFSATLRHASSDAALLAMPGPAPVIGSRVRVTGVCFMDPGNHWRNRLWFDLRMRSLRDISVIQPPSWWTVRRLSYLITILSAVILVAVIWAGLLDRRLRQQTAVLARQSQEDAIRERRRARQEQQRSRILELISSSEPLPEVLREIEAIVSSRLLGARCWIELSSFAGSAASPSFSDNPATVTRELFSPDGTSLGLLRTIPMPNASSETEIAAALGAGACLAELAIDTRRLYSDLRHRSEYDLLTDIPNRFSMEKRLDQLMALALRNEAVFGLIYVDLDEFKFVNDRHGHRIGDLYLKEVTKRMKLQLRSGDVLARIGGDEFIALVPILRNRTDAEEIATRLEHCFDESFDLEGIEIFGSASVGLAVYPEDGATKEELQRSADAAMYTHKEGKRQTGLDSRRLTV